VDGIVQFRSSRRSIVLSPQSLKGNGDSVAWSISSDCSVGVSLIIFSFVLIFVFALISVRAIIVIILVSIQLI
jgi:hypothetical protein